MNSVENQEASTNHHLNTIEPILSGIPTVLREEKVRHVDNICHIHNLPTEILINIMEYVSYTDLKMTRVVCSRWNDLPLFKKRSKLVLNSRNVSDIAKCLLNDGEFGRRFSFDTLKIDFLRSSFKLKSILKTIGPQVRFLHLQRAAIFSFLNKYLCHVEELSIWYVVGMKKKLVCLNLKEFKNLKSLEIGSLVDEVHSTHILNTLSSTLAPKIERLSLEITASDASMQLNTIKYHANSLKQLKLLIWSNRMPVQEWVEVFSSFRQLQALEIHAIVDDTWTKDFLRYLPEKLPLKICELKQNSSLDDSIVKLIIQKWSSTLENMSFIIPEVTDDAFKDLSILHGKLKSINIYGSKKISAECLTKGLASKKNNALKTVILNNISGDSECLKVLAQNLTGLTYLSLNGCRELVTNSSLQYIFQHMEKLQHLILDDCDKIDDNGILGTGQNVVNISSLKGLKTLTFKSIPHVSDRILTEGIRFKGLLTLSLESCDKLTSLGICVMIRHCRTLEELNITRCNNMDEAVILCVVQGLPRIKTLILYDCCRINNIYLDYVAQLNKRAYKTKMKQILVNILGPRFPQICTRQDNEHLKELC